jgi:hypothetical protein
MGSTMPSTIIDEFGDLNACPTYISIVQMFIEISRFDRFS